jgi:cytochrome c
MTLTKRSSLAIFILVLLTVFNCSEKKTQRALLFASRKNNAAINGETIKLILLQAAKNNIRIDTTTQPSFLNEDTLKQYGALVFLNLNEDELDVREQNDVERFVQAGGGFAAIHTQPRTKYQWPWFNETFGVTPLKINDSLVVKTVSVKVVDDDNASTEDLPDSWTVQDALFNLEAIHEDAEVLMRAEDNRPLTWTFERGKSNFFYTLLGGSADASKNENLIKHLTGGIKFALQGSALNYESATTARVPEENRFLQKTLDTYLDEPIEMEVLADGKVLFIERHGKIKLYEPQKNATKIIGELQVQLEGNYEDGLLGLELDPAFEKNQFIYLYYSPLGGEPVQRLSRFKLQGDSIVKSSEKIVLKVPVQRETCCHSAGNVYFGPDGHLYLSTGDNTSSKESDGFTPIDERPGRGPFDAQKSSGNTHDLRGKILRIHVEADGTYTIPDGNLFPKDGSKGRPEIYVMGARNPYRVIVDKRGFLYWGDVGPDGGEDTERGPRSHDEWNQARKPGFFGWPYFVGDNKAYADFDFETNKIGPRFDPANPVNESPNNYGSKTLPPAQPAMIYYPYNASKEFPMLETGSRSAMAGPFYYSDEHTSTIKFPDYYHDKMFIFEWARNWIKVLTFNADGDLVKIESFLPSFDFWHPIDIKFGRDGAMYVLQYGSNYFARNPDAQLVRIEYAEGNRQPIAQIKAEKSVGAAPLTVTLSAKESFDYDQNSNLKYSWDSGNGQKSNEQDASFTYDKPGKYTATLTVTDPEGSTATSTIDLKVGNETPAVTVNVKENSSFYFDNSVLSYNVDVKDKEDGELKKGIDPKNVKFAVDYLKEGKDLALLNSYGASSVSAKHVKGKSLIDASDCKSCHSLDKKSVGPTYLDVAKRYKGKNDAVGMLAQKIIKGGNGNWGHAMMAAHPQLSENDTKQMVEYILSLGEDQGGLPLQGTYKLKEHGKDGSGFYIVNASYTDKGHEITGPLTGRQTFILRNAKVQAEDFDSFKNVGQQRPVNGDIVYVSDIKDGSYISFKGIDLKGINQIVFNVMSYSGRIEIHSGSVDGPLVGTAEMAGTAPEWPWPWRTVSATVKDPGGRNELFFVFRNDTEKSNPFMPGLDWILFKR